MFSSQKKNILQVLIATTVIIIGLGIGSYWAVSKALRQSLSDKLNTVLLSCVDSIQTWTEQQKSIARVNARDSLVSQLIREQVDLANQETTDRETPQQEIVPEGAGFLHSTMSALPEALSQGIPLTE